MYRSTIHHINLSDQFALQIRVRIRLDTELHYFSIFSQKIRKMSTVSSGNITDGNLLLKERTHTINNKIKLHILGVPINKLGNWLIGLDIQWEEVIRALASRQYSGHHKATEEYLENISQEKDVEAGFRYSWRSWHHKTELDGDMWSLVYDAQGVMWHRSGQVTSTN